MWVDIAVLSGSQVLNMRHINCRNGENYGPIVVNTGYDQKNSCERLSKPCGAFIEIQEF